MVHSYSLDDGLTWSAPIVDSLAGPDDLFDGPTLATDNDGHWAIVLDGPGGVRATTATDDGVSWGASSLIGPGGQSPGLATDGLGTWVSAWIGEGGSYDKEVWSSRSTNNGLTWSTPVLVASAVDDSLYVSYRDVRANFTGAQFELLWGSFLDTLGRSIGKEGDIVGVRSLDGGVTWSQTAAMNVNAGRDDAEVKLYTPGPLRNFDHRPAISSNAEGTTILAWTSTNSLDNTIGTDDDILYARSHTDCPLTAMTGCRVPTSAGASTLTIKNPVGGRDSLQWNWRSGEATLPADLGDPTAATSYALCLYDKAGPSVRSVLELDAAAATTCKKGACWAASGEGFRYNDPDRRNGPIRSVSLAPGADGRAGVAVKAAGPALAPPPMPLAVAPSVKVQLLNIENNECWEATFSIADTNTATLFQAHSD